MRSTAAVRRRGMSTPQAVMLLGVGFLVVWGLMGVWTGSEKSAAENVRKVLAGEGRASGTGTGDGGTTDDGQTEPPGAGETGNGAGAPAAGGASAGTETGTAPPTETKPTAQTAQERWDEIRPTVDEAKLAAEFIYKTDLKEKETRDGFTVERLLDDKTSGLRIAVLSFKRANGEVVNVLASAGTEPGQDLGRVLSDPLTLFSPIGSLVKHLTSEGTDLGTDLRQQVGLIPAQYQTALQFAEQAMRDYDLEYGTGHSLGGGEETFISGMTGLPVIVFNAAPLGFGALDLIDRRGVPHPERNVTNINVRGELVSDLGQRVNGWLNTILPANPRHYWNETVPPNNLPFQGRAQQIGEEFSLPNSGRWGQIIRDHLMASIDPSQVDQYIPAKPLDRVYRPNR